VFCALSANDKAREFFYLKIGSMFEKWINYKLLQIISGNLKILLALGQVDPPSTPKLV